MYLVQVVFRFMCLLFGWIWGYRALIYLRHVQFHVQFHVQIHVRFLYREALITWSAMWDHVNSARRASCDWRFAPFCDCSAARFMWLQRSAVHVNAARRVSWDNMVPQAGHSSSSECHFMWIQRCAASCDCSAVRFMWLQHWRQAFCKRDCVKSCRSCELCLMWLKLPGIVHETVTYIELGSC